MLLTIVVFSDFATPPPPQDFSCSSLCYRSTVITAEIIFKITFPLVCRLLQALQLHSWGAAGPKHATADQSQWFSRSIQLTEFNWHDIPVHVLSAIISWLPALSPTLSVSVPSEITCTVSSGTLNPSIPYHSVSVSLSVSLSLSLYRLIPFLSRCCSFSPFPFRCPFLQIAVMGKG